MDYAQHWDYGCFYSFAGRWSGRRQRFGPLHGRIGLEKGGGWKEIVEADVDVKGSSIAKAEQPDVIKRMAGYAEMLHQALGEQKGYAATRYRSVGGEVYNGGPRSYRLNVPLYSYNCYEGKLGLEDESEVSVHANGVWAMAGPEARFIIGGKKYYQFGSPLGDIRGFPAFQADTHNAPDGVQVTWVVLVSKPGKFPFKVKDS